MNGEKENNLSSPQQLFQTDSSTSTPSLSSPLSATPESVSLFGVGGGAVGGIIEESELTPIQQWKLVQQQKIGEKEKQAEEEHKIIIEQAIKDIEQFYQEYNQNKTKIIEENRKMVKGEDESMQVENTQMLNNTTEVNDPKIWELVRKVAERIKKPKGTRDVSRMKEVLQTISEKNNS